jgi:HAMP domain-containing protein
MKLRTKFNFVLLFVFAVALAGTSFLSFQLLQKNAREEIIQHAGMMMEAVLAIRSYTVKEIRPLLAHHLTEKFLPQTVPAYAATTSFNALRAKHPEYSYKEATLNPTNPKNRAVDWETDIIQAFKNRPELPEIIGTRDTPTGKSLYLARPIQIKNEGCLTCHSSIESAPGTLLVKYGDTNGFGWQMNEIVGAQIINVPMSVTIKKAQDASVIFIGTLAGVFIFIMILLNLMLGRIVIRPINRMANIADQVSLGDMSAPEFKHDARDEVTVLAESFSRMRRSLEKAMKMLDNPSTRSR